MAIDDDNIEELQEELGGIDGEERVEYEEKGPLATEDQREMFQADQMPNINVTDEEIAQDVQRADSWLVYNKGLEERGFSPASALTPENVGTLSKKWEIPTESGGMEVNPLVVPTDPPVMFFSTSNMKIFAVNARTGEKFWTFKFGLPEDPPYQMFPRSRGVAVYGDKVYMGTINMKLVAVDANTGEKQWVTDALTREQKLAYDYPWVGYGVDMAPVPYDGKIFAGQAGGDSSTMGYAKAFALDADTGEKLWATSFVPKDEWVGNSWIFGNGAPWMSPAYDRKTKTVVYNAANPGPMVNPLVRPGPNQMTSGIVALDAETGEVKWNDQIVKHDIWDMDGQFTPIIADAEINGEKRRVVVANHKTCWSYMYDIETGALLQRSRQFAPQDGVFFELIPAGEENAEVMKPAIFGGAQWPPDSVDVKRSKTYMGTHDYSQTIWYNPGWDYNPDTGNPEDTAGGGTGIPEGLGQDIKHKAYVTALDLSTGEVDWEFRLEDVKTEWPAARVYTGGTTATEGGLVFHGSAGGHVYALDAETGEKLWEDATGTRILASPIIWSDPKTGKQHITVATGSNIVTYAGGETGDNGGGGNSTNGGGQ